MIFVCIISILKQLNAATTFVWQKNTDVVGGFSQEIAKPPFKWFKW
jgi:hypothetical protein